ncbi:3-deoxy-manno-octulosonate cytidylyltransferase [bacterium BMS3Bbin11]|nr:3-deoxy-manno-octulosonate cytidylyltransferase [bacterium BMS3Abin11]GBE45048.1 3-deoxy-manno-octulosonate cytidylyltransferase [bacterium BMS3Bbin11]HDH09191.1 3-deoxy-manno-octulosonate cytidylyltransferase [Gammaproteobacteria bacterium]
MSFHIIIPARFESTRLPGKPLLDIAGKPMIQHVYERATEAGAASVTVATDNLQVEQVVRGFGGNACLTNDRHVSGTDRLAEAVQIIGLSDNDMVVNLQGDEPLMPASLISHVAQTLQNDKQAVVATASILINDPTQISDPNVVKVVADSVGHALYFSRSTIPCLRDVNSDHEPRIFRHIGLYAYRCGYLSEFSQLEPCVLEQVEALEQLRVLWYGGKIAVMETTEDPGHGVDTPEDLQKVRALFEE